MEIGGAMMPESESSDEPTPSTVPCSRSEAAFESMALMPLFAYALPIAKSTITPAKLSGLCTNGVHAMPATSSPRPTSTSRGRRSDSRPCRHRRR